MKARRSTHTMVASFPNVTLFENVDEAFKKLNTIFSTVFANVTEKFQSLSSRFRETQNRRLPGDKKKFLPKLILSLIIISVIVVAGYNLKKSLSSKPNSDQRIQIQPAKATLALNKEYAYPLLDSKGKEVSKLKYIIENVDLRDELIVDGKRAVAVKGREFLILTIKLTNEYDKAIEVNARDYIRLSVNNNQNELLAADIHNDPVVVQAISTKYTRIGFPINDTDTNHTLIVGEIKGNKENVPIKF